MANVIAGYLFAPDASKALKHFLDNTGEDFKVSVTDAKNNSLNINKHYNDNLSSCKKFCEMVAMDGETIYFATKNDKPLVFSSLSTDHIHIPGGDNNWWFTIGDSDCAMSGKVSRNGNTYILDLNYYLFDFYDWDPLHKFGGFVYDDEMNYLHSIGEAKEFLRYGSYSSKITWIKK